MTKAQLRALAGPLPSSHGRPGRLRRPLGNRRTGLARHSNRRWPGAPPAGRRSERTIHVGGRAAMDRGWAIGGRPGREPRRAPRRTRQFAVDARTLFDLRPVR